jgi:hypothetical protein
MISFMASPPVREMWVRIFVHSLGRISTIPTAPTVWTALDLAELDIDLAAITQAGGWKSTRMPLQYAEKINAGRSGMARAAAATGRDDARSE